MNDTGRVGEEKQRERRKRSSEGQGGGHPVGACYAVPRVRKKKQLDQTSMNDG